MKDLFTPLTRDERQEESLKKWLLSKGKGTIEGCTGYGKTRVALNAIKRLLTKYPNIRVLVVVPTDLLRLQWLDHIDSNGLGLNVEVAIINTAAKTKVRCDLLILDEIHRFAADTFSAIFEIVQYKLILGLTATIERLDGKHVLINQYCPVIDTITLKVAKLNGWVSDFTEYQVIITVDDLDTYKGYNKEFVSHFEFFNFDWDLVMSMLGQHGFINRAKYRDKICENEKDESKRKEVFKQITYHATAFMRSLQNRKKFIYNHPKKLDVAFEIIKNRLDKKVITFSANTSIAESLDSRLRKENITSYVYTGKEGKKKNRITQNEFNTINKGVINSCKLAIEGFDCPGLSIGIVLGVDSSPIKATQSTGRVIRKEGSKYAEMFTLVIEGTVECEWFRKSHQNSSYVTIDVDNLIKLLNGEPWEPYKKKVQNFTYRF